MSDLQFADDSTDTHGRYVVVSAEAPGLANITDLIDNREDETITSIVAVDVHGGSEQVQAPVKEGGVWIVRTVDGATVEEIEFDEAGETVVHHATFVDGFTTDECPQFMVGITDRRR